MIHLFSARLAAICFALGGSCISSLQAQMVVAHNPDAAYQKLPYAKVRHVLLYDYTCGGIPKEYTRDSFIRLASKYGFRLDRGQTKSYITPATLQGVDVVVLSNGDCDVLGEPTPLSAIRNFVEAQGKGILLIHAAASYVPCPDVNNLADPNCRWLVKAIGTAFYTHNSDPTYARIYADTIVEGQALPNYALQKPPFKPFIPPGDLYIAAISHGLKNAETRMIFESTLTPLPLNGGEGPAAASRHVWDGFGTNWYVYYTYPRWRTEEIIEGIRFGPINILLSLDESTITNPNSTLMGDRSVSWTRKVGNGNAAYQNAGHFNVYTRRRIVGETEVVDSLIEKYNWNLIRYLARDFVGCMDKNYAEYNPEASVTVLNTGHDDPNPCRTPLPNGLARTRPDATGRIFALGSVLRIEMAEDASHRIQISDVKGRTVFSGSTQGPGRIDIPGLGKGSYVVKLNSPAGERIRKVEIDAE